MLRLPRITTLALALILPTAAVTLRAQQQTLPLWPQGTPEHTPAVPVKDVSNSTLVAGKPLQLLTNISNPTLTFYPAPATHNTGAAVVVFPGGGYAVLAADLEGSEACVWLNGIGVNCAVAQYRVPQSRHYPDSLEPLEDAQAAMRLMRAHATQWHIDPNRIGVLGFSAGANLAVVLSAHAGQPTPGTPTNAPSAHPDFAIIGYPAYLAAEPDRKSFTTTLGDLSAAPPTFIFQAEDDPVHVENAVQYFLALKALKIPTELHIYAEGGHGYGLRPTGKPIAHWPDLATTWLQTIHILKP